MHARVALTRAISPTINRCELTHLDRVGIDLAIARRQHAAYERALEALGCEVRQLSASDEMPDAVFVEDTAIVFDELAIITRPGAASRRVETAGVADALAPHRPLRSIEAPGTVDGGDVLVLSRRVFVGCSGRTNAAGVEQMRGILAPLGYTVETADVVGCLHLKSAVSAVGDRTLLINRRWIDASRFDAFTLIDTDPAEPFAANALRVGETVIFPSEFHRTAERLRRAGVGLHLVSAGELAKAEGGVTCCSLIVEAREAARRGPRAGSGPGMA